MKHGSNALDRYIEKRDRDATDEPFGGSGIARPGLFMVHHHQASSEHYDLRLEHEGVLLSFAIPKGPSMNPADKRLAVHVEDHPLDYSEYEGVIAEGQYGAGPSLVWDRGRYRSDGPLEPSTGKLSFDLYGYKLRGHFSLVRTRRSGQWLLMKKDDEWAHDAPLEPRGVLSGRTVAELGAPEATDRVRAEALAAYDLSSSPLAPGAPEAMLAQTATEPPGGDEWLHELKIDGYRLLAARRDGVVTLTYRSGRDATMAWPEVVRVMRALPGGDLLVDGEITVQDPSGHPDFHRVQGRGMVSDARTAAVAELDHPATYYAFDLLHQDGHDLRTLPLESRKSQLRALLPPLGAVRFTEHFDDGRALYDAVGSAGLEGVMSKKRDGVYRSGRHDSWLKVPAARERAVAVVGWTARTSDPQDLGALVAAVWTGTSFRCVGKVGTGFSAQERKRLLTRLAPLAQDTPSASEPPPGTIQWVEPDLVVGVRFTRWTDDGRLRHPRYTGEHADTAPQDCVDDAPGHEPPAPEPVGPTTNRDKVLWPAVGLTKGALVDYYDAVADRILPWLADRPATLVRYPDGIDGTSFFQKNTPDWAPDFVRTIDRASDRRSEPLKMLCIHSPQVLHWAANLATIAIHTEAARASEPQHPDWLALDLDPKDAPFEWVVRIANAVKTLCDDIDLPVGCKTSGKSGLHCLVPLGAAYDQSQARMLADLLATVVCAELPDIATMQRSVKAREGRVYVDTVQNGAGKQLVCAWSARESERGTVSTPLSWSEVEADLDPRAFTMERAAQRAHTMGDPLWEAMSETVDLGRALTLLAERTG